MTIGQLAKSTNVQIETIRYYEKIKLLSKPKVSAAGYRIYTDDYKDRINYILKAKELGFTLREIKEISGLKDCGDLFEMTSIKIDEVKKKVAIYNQLIKKLELLIKKCPTKGSIDKCSIIKSISKN